MRRTYRSKKETSGALDHKDVLLNMDEKSSAFDAFYIQNIKHTKREMSSVNLYAAHSRKVRKRKYVKRIGKEVKDVEPIRRVSELDSVFLTPDKSLRVNKPLDPFDQLLNSSSTKNDSVKFNKGDLFDRIQKEGKTYKRKCKQIKKYNCSSSESTDSDKENPKDNTQDTSNIKMHQLLIENENQSSPIHFDKSLNDLVRNFPRLKETDINSTPGGSSNIFNKHRLTKVLEPLQNSPLCSTPFKEKYRGASIYKFSPIKFGDLNTSPNCMNTSHPISNNSIVKNNNNKLPDIIENIELYDSNLQETLQKSLSPTAKDDLSVIICTVPSPIISEKCKSIRKVENDSVLVEEQPHLINSLIDNELDEMVDQKSIQILEVKSDKEISSIELSSLYTTESEPFLGFSNNKETEHNTVDFEDDHEISNDSVDKSICKEYEENSQNSDTNERVENSHHFISQEEISLIDHSLEKSVILCQNNKKSEEVNSLKNSKEEEEECYMLSEDDESSETKNESMYDTCDSGQSDNDFAEVNGEKEPVVMIEKMNDSEFHKYCKENSEYDTESNSSHLNSESYNSLGDIDDNTSKIPIENSLVNTSNSSAENKFIVVQNDDLDTSESNDTDSNSYNEEDRCISFVTMRRRNEITNDSMKLGFNSSFNSNSDGDKTVLSNRGSILEKSNLIVNEETLVENTPIDTAPAEVFDASPKEARKLTVTRKSSREAVESKNLDLDTEEARCTRKSSREKEAVESSHLNLDPKEARQSTVITRKSSKGMDTVEHELDQKPSIVLQPGKKWERSLSIYRRMSLMTDHFDRSILDDEPMLSKGRKYRQSVISTMEMQDKDSLHNDSINSRRSTFVSKPCRSTIRIVKEPNSSRLSLSTTVCDDGFLNEDCDDTIVELSKLSIADSEHEVTVLEKFHETARVSTARDYVLRRCNQTDLILFDECYPDPGLKNCRKIGEGVYGEVFLWRAGDGRARVMKIVPIAGDIKVNGEHQKDFQEIISEIVIAMELSALRAPIAAIERHFDEGNDIEALDLQSVENATDVFNEVLAVRCVVGSYPSRLLDLWELYDECKGSENDNPAILPIDQQYIVLELANAGQDLESYQFNSAEQAHALFLQVAYGLAVGEESFQFEHRDLHWGNVLIAPTEQKFATFVLRGRAHRVPRGGVAATIIDYSLSRLSLSLARGDSAALYNDLSTDDGLFDAVGDYQFQVYRLMRDKLGNDWKNFEPYTNILWLHYTVDKMITALRYKRINTKIHKHYIGKLKGIKNRLLDYGSAAQFVLTDNEL